MSTLQERLRYIGAHPPKTESSFVSKALLREAADRLDELEREVEALRAERDRARAERNQMHERITTLETALGKIDAIRNSIIGAQKVNWSEHIYPLVAALEAAGYRGQEYEVARENVGTMVDRIAALEREMVALRKPTGAQIERALLAWFQTDGDFQARMHAAFEAARSKT